jgi:hypothetical protein
MRARILVALTIVLSCVTGVWAVVDVNYVYVGNVAGDFHRISSVDYHRGYRNIIEDGNVVGISVLSNGRVAIGLKGNSGVLVVSSGDPYNWEPNSAGVGPIVALTALPTGDIAFVRSDGIYSMINGYNIDNKDANLVNWEYLPYMNPLGNIVTLADGSVAFEKHTISDPNSTIGHAPGIRPPLEYWTEYVPGWGVVSAMAPLANGNLVFCTTAGGVFITTKEIVSVYVRLGSVGTASAITELADGKIAVGNTAGEIYVVSGDLATDIAAASGYGTITKMAALPNGILVVADAQGDVYFIDPANSTTLAAPVNTIMGLGNISAMAVGKAPPWVAACGDLEHTIPVGDIDGNCIVNLADMAMIAVNWLVDHRP